MPNSLPLRRSWPFLVLVLCALRGTRAEVAVDGWTVALPDGGDGSAIPLQAAGQRGAIAFHDGRTEVFDGGVHQRHGAWRTVEGVTEWRGEGGVTARLELEPVGSLAVLSVTITAHEGPEWVRTEVRLPFAFPADWWAFDGRGERPGRRGQIRQRRLLGTFPAVAAYDRQSGIGIGLAPDCWVSTLEPAILAPDGKHGAVALSVPLALDPGRPETLRFALCRFVPGPFGALPLIQRWHDSFVDSFCPAEGIDPRVLQGSAAGAVDHRPDPKHWPDGFDGRAVCAGARVGWEWKYAKFKSGGDLVGREDDWNLYTPDRASAPYLGTLEAFLAWRGDNFAYTESECGVAPLFYYINWVDEHLAPRFADSLIRAEDVFDGRGAKITRWIHTYSTDVRAFPWANSLGDRLAEDMAWLCDHLPIAGFAHDVAVGGSRYRPVRYLPGRAYDRDGVWVDEGLGIAATLRHAHSLRTGDGRYRCGTSANFTGEAHYAIVTETDNPIFEGTVYGALGDARRATRDRWLLGRKPRSWYVHLYSDDVGNAVDPDKLDAEQLRDVLRSRWDSAILWSFRFGWLPCPDLVYGYAPMLRALPLLHDCVAAGWQAVPAMTADQPLWLARYGTGLETRLVVMNPHDSLARQARVRVWCRWLGEGGFVFANADGSATENRFEGDDTLLTVELPPRSWRLYLCVGRRNGGPASLTVETQPRYDPRGGPDPVGVIESHMGVNPPFFVLPRLEATKRVYEKAELIRRELPER